MSKFAAVLLALCCLQAGYLANDAMKWFSGINYINTVIK